MGSVVRYVLFSVGLCVAIYALAYTSFLPSRASHLARTSFLTRKTALTGVEQQRSTKLEDLLFGIAAGSEVWNSRKEYVKVWWRPGKMRGFVWLDRPVESTVTDNASLPALVLSANTSRFRYSFVGLANQNEQKQQIRMARVVTEMFRLGQPDVKWFVMGDDDTIFFPDNLVNMLSKYDYRKYYYIGCSSESHLQNVQGFSDRMAYGGAGYVISYALAERLEKMQDECIQRYHFLYSGDARVHACIGELGVPLTMEPGFHQMDIHGDGSGLLGSHPLAPLVSLHHVDRIDPLFPTMDRVQSLKHLLRAVNADPAATLQQSICYSMDQLWSIKVAWGFAVHIMRGLVSPRDLEVPVRSFIGWHDDRTETGFAFKTYSIPADPCLRYNMFFMSNVTTKGASESVSIYLRKKEKSCTLQDALSKLIWLNVTKQPTPASWFELPRRQCCRVLQLGEYSMDLYVGDCEPDELSTIRSRNSV